MTIFCVVMCLFFFFWSFGSYVTVERNNKKAAFQNTGTNGAIIRAVFCLMRSKLPHTRGVEIHSAFTQVHCYAMNTFARRKCVWNSPYKTFDTYKRKTQTYRNV